MGAAALLIGPAIGLVLLKPLLGTVRRSTDALKGAKARAADAKRDAAAANKRAETTAEKLAKARELAERQERELDRQKQGGGPVRDWPVPPSPDEPELHEVELEKAPPPAAKPSSKSETVEELGKEQPTKRQWAEQLYAYASREIHEGRSPNLGTKGHPNERVRAAQAGMGKLTADGIYGDKTRARGKELLGKSFPIRKTTAASSAAPKQKPAAATPPAPPKPTPAKPAPAKPSSPAKQPAPPPAPKRETTPAKRTPVQAAEALLAYAKQAIADGAASRFGTKAAPSSFVRDAQADMGELTADGIYGPNTRARGKALTGKTFPARA